MKHALLAVIFGFLMFFHGFAQAERAIDQGTPDGAHGYRYDGLPRRRPIQRLRIVHQGGPVIVEPSADGRLHVVFDDIEGLPPGPTGLVSLISRAPFLRIRLDEVSEGNLHIETFGQDAQATPRVEPTGQGFLHIGGNVRIGGGVNIQIGGGERPAPAAPNRPRGTLRIQVPLDHLAILSATTAFGNVELTDIALRPREPENVVHGASGNGSVTFRRVSGGVLWSPDIETGVIDDCTGRITTQGRPGEVDLLFRP